MKFALFLVVLASLFLGLCAPWAAQAEKPTKLSPFEAVSQHGDWLALPIPGRAPVPNVVVIGPSQAGLLFMNLSHRSPECIPPVFSFQFNGRLGADGGIIPIVVAIDNAKPRTFKGHISWSSEGTCFIDPEFLNEDDMTNFVFSLFDARRAKVAYPGPTGPAQAVFDLNGMLLTASEAMQVCLKANGRPIPGPRKTP